mgnify:CR=1 FL=1
MRESAREVAGAELGAVVGEALRRWQREHPRATFDEIVAAVDAALLPVRAQYISELAAAEEAELVAAQRCPACGGPVQRRGRRARAVLLPGQHAALRLERTQVACSSCGRSLFPPG